MHDNRNFSGDTYFGGKDVTFIADNILFDSKNKLILNNSDLTTELQEMKKTIKELQEMITQIYYAPGMPGYILAQERS